MYRWFYRLEITESPGLTGYEHQNVEVSYNNLKYTSGLQLGFIREITGIGPVYGYRNTTNGGSIEINYTQPLAIKGNVSTTATTNNGADVTVTSDYLVSASDFETDKRQEIIKEIEVSDRTKN